MVCLRWCGPSDPRGGRVLGDLRGVPDRLGSRLRVGRRAAPRLLGRADRDRRGGVQGGSQTKGFWEEVLPSLPVILPKRMERSGYPGEDLVLREGTAYR